MKKCMRSYFPYLVTANLQAMNTQTSGLLPTRNRADLALEVSSDSFQESRRSAPEDPDGGGLKWLLMPGIMGLE